MNRYFRSSLLISLGVGVALQGCIPYYAPEFQARLVDADTGEPIDGAIVVAHWQILGGLEGGNPVGEAMVMEAVTDKTGSIYFPSWSRFSWKVGGVQNSRPELLAFKRRYNVLRLNNNSRPSFIDNLILRSDWNGKTLKLESFKGNEQDYMKEIAWLDEAMHFSRWGRHCEWKQTPRMLVAIQKMRLVFESKALYVAPGTIHSATEVDDQGACGAAHQFLQPYLQEEPLK